MKLQPLPKLQPITKLSPTLFATLKQCSLRAGFCQAKAQQTTRSSKAALLGTVAHRVLEKAGTISRDSEDLRTQAEAIWGEVVGGMEKVKCHPLFGPKFSKVKIRFVFEIREVSDTLTPNVGVFGDTPV